MNNQFVFGEQLKVLSTSKFNYFNKLFLCLGIAFCISCSGNNSSPDRGLTKKKIDKEETDSDKRDEDQFERLSAEELLIQKMDFRKADPEKLMIHELSVASRDEGLMPVLFFTASGATESVEYQVCHSEEGGKCGRKVKARKYPIEIEPLGLGAHRVKIRACVSSKASKTKRKGCGVWRSKTFNYNNDEVLEVVSLYTELNERYAQLQELALEARLVLTQTNEEAQVCVQNAVKSAKAKLWRGAVGQLLEVGGTLLDKALEQGAKPKSSDEAEKAISESNNADDGESEGGSPKDAGTADGNGSDDSSSSTEDSTAKKSDTEKEESFEVDGVRYDFAKDIKVSTKFESSYIEGKQLFDPNDLSDVKFSTSDVQLDIYEPVGGPLGSEVSGLFSPNDPAKVFDKFAHSTNALGVLSPTVTKLSDQFTKVGIFKEQSVPALATFGGAIFDLFKSKDLSNPDPTCQVFLKRSKARMAALEVYMGVVKARILEVKEEIRAKGKGGKRKK